MKKVMFLLTITTIMAMLLVTSSCSDRMITDSDNSMTTFKNPCDFVGVQHNAGLDYVFNALKDKVDNGEKISKTDALNLVSDKYDEFCFEYIENVQLLPESAWFDFDNISEVLHISSRETVLDSVIANSNISDEQREYLERVATYIDEYSTLLILQDSLNTLESEIESDMDLTSEEKVYLFSATSISICSTEYWDENRDEWVDILNSLLDDNISNDDLPSIENTAAADIAGAIAGGIIGGLSGGITGGLAASVFELLYPWLCTLL